MKYLFYVAIGVCVCGLWIGTLVMAYGAGARAAARIKMREYGIHKSMQPLYRRAVKILNRLAALTDLDGTMAGDQLSPETRQLVTEWVNDYKREISKT